MNPVKVFTKAIIVLASDSDDSRGCVVTFVDGKTSAAYPHRPMAEALAFAERLANNEADLELARIRASSANVWINRRRESGPPCRST